MFHGGMVAALVFALASLIRPGQDSLVNLWWSVDTIRDDAGRLSLADVRAPDAPWRLQISLHDVHMATRLHPSITWFRFRVHPTESGGYFLVVSQHALDAQLSVPLDNGTIVVRKTGGLHPAFQKRESATMVERAREVETGDDETGPLPTDEQNVIALPTEALDGRPLYLRVVSSYNHNSVFMLVGERRWMQKVLRWQAWERPQLLFAGFVTAFGAISILLGLRLRRTAFAFYAAAVISAAVQVLVLTGDAWRWLWPGLGIDYDIAITVSYTLAIGFAVAFGRAFLETRRRYPRIDRFILAALAVFVAINAFIVLAPELLIVVGQYDPAESEATALVLAPLVWCAVVAARGGSREASAYLLAVVGVLMGNVIGWLSSNLLLPFQTPYLLAPTLGFAWEALLFSLALAERARTYERDVYIDPLTRLTNRRALEQTLARELEHAQRTKAPLSLLVLDIDFFKGYNDRFGHLAGDVALQRVAKIFGGSLRAIDCAARFGGEEFVALLPGTDVAAALAVGDRVRTALREAAIAHPGGIDGLLTVSVGAATAQPGDSGNELIARADSALYAAKGDGRDRVRAA